MKLLSQTHTPGPRLMLFQRACGYAAAGLLPWFGTQLTLHRDALRSTPLCLSIACVVAFTLLVNLSTGIMACISTAVAFNHFVIAPPHAWMLTPRGLLHTAAILIVAILVALLCERQRIISARLRHALSSLQGQTDALVEAQQGSNSVAWRFNTADRCMKWADGGAEVFGRSFAEICTLDTPVSLVLPEDRGRFEQAFEASLSTGDTLHIEFRVRWPNGEIHWLEARGSAASAHPEILHGVMIDITERKNAELALLQSEKLAAIGRLSATVAHEINNPLEAVTNLIFLASLDHQVQPETTQYLAQAEQELARLATIARHTLTFARPGVLSGPVNLADVVENVVMLFQPRCKSRGGQIRLLCQEDLHVTAPPDELRQIFANLITNACDALPDAGGVVEVQLAGESETAVIQIRDNGTGIAEENHSRIFEPFFTTKEGFGTGIGLWITRELVQKNGGRISVHAEASSSEFRTVFRLEFSRTEQPASALLAASSSGRQDPQ